MRRCAFVLLAAGAALLAAGLLSLPALVLAQSGGYDLGWNTVDGGGATTSTGSGYVLGGTIGQPDAGILSSGSYTLRGGFWRPSCVAAAVDVTIALDGETVILSWTTDAANEAYQVHRATTPYFTPTDATRRAWVTTGLWPDPDSPVAVGDPVLNYYYLVRPTCGASYVDAGRTGEFDFALVPGSP